MGVLSDNFNFQTISCSAHNFHTIYYLVIYGRYSLYKLAGELLISSSAELKIKIEGLKNFQTNFPHPPAKQRRITS